MAHFRLCELPQASLLLEHPKRSRGNLDSVEPVEQWLQRQNFARGDA
jgi:hypothetical protein